MPITIRVLTIVSIITLAGLTGCSDSETPAAPVSPGGTNIYVDGPGGSDDQDGSVGSPYKTITKALSMARSGDGVTVAPGIYDAANGETFPLDIPDGVTLQGTDWDRCTIKVNAEAQGTRHAVTMGCKDCAIRNFTLEEEKITDPFVTYFVNMYECTGAFVDSLRTLQRTVYGALKIQRDSGSTIQNCYFNDSDTGYHERGVSLLDNESGNNTKLINVTVTGYLRGMVFYGPQNTVVEFCSITGNQIGVDLGPYGEPSIQPNPDFGGGARGGRGQNDLSGNVSYGILNGTRHTIYAKFCDWAHVPPTSGVDYWNSDEAGGGSIIWQ